MTRERVIEILHLVLNTNEKLKAIRSDYSVGLEIRMRHISLDIFIFNVPEDEIGMYSYTTEILKDYDHEGIRTISDPEMEQGEAHLRRILHDLELD